MPPKESADLLIEARWVLPMLPLNTALTDHAVAITAGRITALGPAAQLNARFEPRERIVRANHALLPGFVNAHTHAAACLLRGAQDAPAAEQRYASADFVRDGTRIAIAEMLQAGITCFADASLFPEEAARAAAAAHVRAAVGLPVSDAPTAWAESPTEHFAKAQHLWDAYGSDPYVSLYFAPPSATAVGDATLSRLRRLTDELDARVAMPLHESLADVRAGVVRDGRRPLHRLHSLGLLRPGFTAIHVTHLDDSDFEIVARTGIRVVACPQAGLRLGGGVCPVSRLGSSRVAVGLGTGSPAVSGALDLLAEARAMALVAGAGGEPALTAEAALQTATLGGAAVLGLSSSIGSIEPGKAADLVCFDLGALAFQPAIRPAAAIVFCATRAHASDVWTSGRTAVSGGRLLAFDEQEILATGRQWAARIERENAA